MLLYKKKDKSLVGCMIRPSNILRNYEIFFSLKEKWSHFHLKSWVIGGIKIRPRIPSNSNQIFCRVNFKNWLSISSQFDSSILQLLGILGRILVEKVTPLFYVKMTSFFLSVFINLDFIYYYFSIYYYYMQSILYLTMLVKSTIQLY